MRARGVLFATALALAFALAAAQARAACGTGSASVSSPAGVSLRATFEHGVGVRAKFALGASDEGRLELYDITGHIFVVAYVTPASREVTLLGAEIMPPGTWFVRLVTPTQTRTAKVKIAR